MIYVVFSRGLLRVEGKVEDECDYKMVNGRPTFYSKIKKNDIVSVFVYDMGYLIERRDYFCLDTDANKPLRARKCVLKVC